MSTLPAHPDTADHAAGLRSAYVHIPFCASKCDYCAFATWTDRHHLTDAYLEALRVDISRAVDAGMPVASTVFVGGGTPSMLETGAIGQIIDTSGQQGHLNFR